MKLVVGSDHCGFALKQALIGKLKSDKCEIEDMGCYDANPVDFPDIASQSM